MILIGDVVEILSGYAFKSNLFNESGEGLPLVRIRDVGKQKSETYYSGEYSDAYLLKNGDFIIGMDGDFRLAKWLGGKALLNQRVCKIIPNQEKIDPTYLFYILPKELKKIEDVTSFATVKHLSVKDIKAISIPLPPIAEQQKIAAILDAADSLRQKDQQLVERYTALSQSLFLEMFGDPVTNPMGWEKALLGDVGNWRSGGTPDRKNQGYFTGDIPWVTSGELNDCYLTDTKEHISEEAIEASSAKVIEKGSLLLGMYDTAALKSSITTGKMSCNQAIAYAKLDSKKVNVLFIYHLIQYAKEHYKRLQRGVRQKNLNLSMVKEIEIIYPPISLQNKFAESIKLIKAQKQQAQASLEKSEALFNSLLQLAFTGELTAKMAA